MATVLDDRAMSAPADSDVRNRQAAFSWTPISVVLAIVGTAVSVLPLAGAFNSARPVAVAIISALIAVVITAISPRLRLPVVLGVAISALIVVVVGPLITAASMPSPSAVSAFIGHARHGVRRSLTTGLPLASTGPYLVVPYVLGWLVGQLTMLSFQLARRSFACALPLAGGLAASSVLAAPDHRFDWIAAVLTTLFALLLVAVGTSVKARSPGSAGELVHAVRWSVGSACCVGVAALLLPAVSGPPKSFRVGDQNSTLLLSLLDPLDNLLTQVHPPDRQRTLIATVEGPKVLRYRLVTFDRFNGSRWAVGEGADYRTTGDVFSATKGAAIARVTVVLGPNRRTFPFVPIPGRTVGIDSQRERRRPDTGELVDVGDADSPLRIVSELPSLPAAVANITAAIPGRPIDEATRAGTAADRPRKLVRTEAEAIARPTGQETAIDQLKRVETELRNWVYSKDASPGASYAQVVELLSANPDLAHRGTAERYATAFALLVRALGYDSRVVLGAQVNADRYTDQTTAQEQCSGPLAEAHKIPRIPYGEPSVSPGNGVVALCTTDLHLWPEVSVGGQWIAFDPTPDQANSTALGAPSPRPDTSTTTVAPAADADSSFEIGVDPDAAKPDSVGNGGLTMSPRALAILAIATVIVGLAASIVVGKRQFRRNLKRGTAVEQVLASRDIMDDRLAEAGVRYNPSQTTRERVTVVSDRLGDVASATYGDTAAVIDAALYDPAGVTADEARIMREQLTRFQREVRHRRGWWRMPVDILNPTPLFMRSERLNLRRWFR